jgi:hypothetical protein
LSPTDEAVEALNRHLDPKTAGVHGNLPDDEVDRVLERVTFDRSTGELDVAGVKVSFSESPGDIRKASSELNRTIDKAPVFDGHWEEMYKRARRIQNAEEPSEVLKNLGELLALTAMKLPDTEKAHDATVGFLRQWKPELTPGPRGEPAFAAFAKQESALVKGILTGKPPNLGDDALRQAVNLRERTAWKGPEETSLGEQRIKFNGGSAMPEQLIDNLESALGKDAASLGDDALRLIAEDAEALVDRLENALGESPDGTFRSPGEQQVLATRILAVTATVAPGSDSHKAAEAVFQNFNPRWKGQPAGVPVQRNASVNARASSAASSTQYLATTGNTTGRAASPPVGDTPSIAAKAPVAAGSARTARR